MAYNPQKIEVKWQKIWVKNKFYQAEDFSKRPKKYILIEFPYPSGEGLHVGHVRSYSALDAIARKKRMEGYNVLFPIGWDAFGLPTENYALKTGIHPQIATEKNIANYKRQLKDLGLSFDWSREINTTDPEYYKWTQWIFLKLFERGLAYQAKIPINWCPSCKIGLANEEVVNGACERCNMSVEKKTLKQWMLKITAYADRLIDDLDTRVERKRSEASKRDESSLSKVDYPTRVKAQQIEWIGKSYGAEIDFKIVDSSEIIKVFTTRADTLFGVTFMVLAPENPIITNHKSQITNYREVKDYIEETKNKTEIERISENKEKTGVEIQGIKAINPVNGRKIPIFVADYILIFYGYGAIMAVPAHDQRDLEFAKKFKLDIKKVIQPKPLQYFLRNPKDIAAGAPTELKIEGCGWEGEGILINSGQFNGLSSKKAIEKITTWLKKEKLGRKTIQYKLRDWVFSRQHYWGEPIPLVFCENCAVKIKNQKSKTQALTKRGRGDEVSSLVKNRIQNSKVKNEFNKGEVLNPGWIAVPEKDLPVELPYVEKYQPTGTGASPLANITEWVNTTCPKCKGVAKRETDTMPNWAGSNWYFIRYCDPENDKCLADSKKIKYWMPVDWYNGGMEHTTLHLLYSRFIYKFLFDIKIVSQPEPYQRRTSHGMVLAEDGRKMSKSFGNVINPDDIIQNHGADTLRMYEMFMGPFDQAIVWNTQGVKGVYRFLGRVWKLFQERKMQNAKCKATTQNSKLKKRLHQSIKKVTEDIESLKFNTAISSLMEFCNVWQGDKEGLGRKDFEYFLKLLAPFAPHLAEELWQKLGYSKSIFLEKWPKYDSKLIKEEIITLVIQINGKVRDKIEVEVDISEEKAKTLVISREKVKKWIKGKKVKKIIFIPGKLINIVI